MQFFLAKSLKISNILFLFTILIMSCNDEDLFVEAQLDDNNSIIESAKNISKATIFNFDPKNWGIVEGRVSDEIAIKNRDILNTVMAQLKKFGINTMEIGAMDAYFKVD
ncbi:hypothetical protein, partial [Thalassobellus citreus]|uniref:hypothetical protein n=1 Tax=Thalassobellus citreus TaxID=3367752 RepID=UPI0037BA5EED